MTIHDIRKLYELTKILPDDATIHLVIDDEKGSIEYSSKEVYVDEITIGGIGNYQYLKILLTGRIERKIIKKQ